MALRAADIAGWPIQLGGDAPLLAHARDELREHLDLAGRTVGHGRITLDADQGMGGGFTVRIRGDEVAIRGGSPRGALDGACWLLERLGFHWVEPGDAGVTFEASAELEEGEYAEEPSFPTRTLVLGQDALHDDWRQWLTWASRNRLNDVFFHDTPPSRWDRGGVVRPADGAGLAAAGGGWLFERWDDDGRAIRAAAAARGMTLQFGGHHLPALLPRGLFTEHPDWFPEREGLRDARFNLCTSSPGARRHIHEAALAFFARFPGADVYHLWADDIRGGGWCGCTSCRDLSPSDQALRATNLVAAALAEAAPAARIAHLAYHDTIQPPRATQPASNVTLLLAPRERCYAHAIDDEDCRRNRDQYWGPLLGLVPLFARDRSRIQVFEYYSDAILFKGMGPTHLGALPGDARAYLGAGAGNFQNLMVGDRPWIGPPWHAWWMAHCTWNAESDPAATLAEFCQAAFPANSRAMFAYYLEQEAAFLQLLDLRDFEEAPRRDVLDFCDRPRATLRRKVLELPAVEAAFRRCEALVAGLTAAGPEGGRLRREAAQAPFQAAVASHLAHRTIGWEAALTRKPALAGEHAAAAEDALTAIEEWDEEWNTPAHAVITTPMREAMRRHTAQVRRLAEGEPRPPVRHGRTGRAP